MSANEEGVAVASNKPAEPSRSTIIVKYESGSHVLKIEGYAGSKGLGGGKWIESGSFDVGGHCWCIHYYPDGHNFSGDDSHISFYLSLRDAGYDELVKAKFTFSLLDHDDEQPVRGHIWTSDIHAFSSNKNYWGFSKFLNRKKLEESKYLRDDSFMLRCDVAVLKEIRVDPAPAPWRRRHVAVPPPDMHRQLGRLLSSGDGSDVTFQVGDKMFLAHRCVLAARSPVFMEEFFGGGPISKKKEETIVHVNDMEPRVFDAMLQFIYNDSLPDQVEDDDDDGDGFEAVPMAQHLLVAADRYGLERLKLICEDKLCGHVDAGMAATMLVFAEQHDCYRLEDACLKFVENPSNLKTVMASDGIEHEIRTEDVDVAPPTPPARIVAVPPSDMGRHIGRLLANGHGADVTARVGDETFVAHWCVLAARSPVFMAEFFDPMGQGRNIVYVHDMEPKVFEIEVDGDEMVAMAQHLLVVADRYDIKRLKLICEDKLCSHVNASTAFFFFFARDATTALTILLTLAKQHHCDWLKEACLKFMENPSNMRVVMASDDFCALGSRTTYKIGNIVGESGSDSLRREGLKDVPWFVRPKDRWLKPFQGFGRKRMEARNVVTGLGFNLLQRRHRHRRQVQLPPETSKSSIVVKYDSASHVFNVEGYSRLKNLGVGKCVKSGGFNVGGHCWCIKYYPNGYRSNTAVNKSPWISVFLSLSDSKVVPGDVNGEFTISLLDNNNRPVAAYSRSSMMAKTLSGRKRTWGWGFERFMEKKTLEELDQCFRDGSFGIRCDITVIKEIGVDPAVDVAVPPLDKRRNLGHLLSSGDGADVTFLVGDETFAAHRCVLATRSPVFMAELFGPKKKQDEDNIVHVRGMDAKVFENMLRFIYTDTLPEVDGDDDEAVAMVQHLLVAAERYGLKRLKLICMDKMRENVDTSTKVTALARAEQKHCHGLKNACFKFLKDHGCNPGFTGSKALGVGKSIRSSSFDVAGHCWCIKYYPNGDNRHAATGKDDGRRRFISVFLALLDTAAVEVKTKFTFSLLDHDRELPVAAHRRSTRAALTFSRGKPWGFYDFMEREKLEKSGYLRDDSFLLRCDITVVEEIVAEPTPRRWGGVAVPPPDMNWDLGRLLSSGECADVAFWVGDETFPAHRCVLAARSPVFMAELFGPMGQKNKEIVHVHDMDPRVFEEMLYFIYNDSLPEVDDDDSDVAVAMAQHLLVAADRYGLERLKLICEDKMCGHVDTSTAATVLVLAEQHHCQGLKKACFKFLEDASNLTAVLQTSNAAAAPEPSSSSIVVKYESGSHILKVEGYAGSKGIGVGKFIESGSFDVGGHGWCIRYYPDGYRSDGDDGNYIAIILALNVKVKYTATFYVKAKFTFSILDHDDDQPVAAHRRSSQMVTFCSTDSPRWGFFRFLDRKKLEESEYLRDDCFKLRCDVTVVKEICVDTAAPRRRVAVPPPDMHRHLGRLLSSGDGADVTFQVGDEMFPAHRCVLAARSPVFMAELLGPMSQKNIDIVHVHDMDPRVFETMLYFIYNDSLPEVEDGGDGDEAVAMAQHLLVATDRYGLERLKLICEDKMCGHVDVDTAATMLVLAEQHHCQGLKDACFKFMENPNNLKAVMASDGIEHLIKSCRSLLKEMSDKS
uniref:BTB domain-containing protein n=1 Tax=Leersia perrieri TaxID=77586 RepID=A0A0D9XU98_9ORYZ